MCTYKSKICIRCQQPVSQEATLVYLLKEKLLLLIFKCLDVFGVWLSAWGESFTIHRVDRADPKFINPTGLITMYGRENWTVKKTKRGKWFIWSAVLGESFVVPSTARKTNKLVVDQIKPEPMEANVETEIVLPWAFLFHENAGLCGKDNNAGKDGR